MYFGLAFSRVGLDFRALMVPIFEKAILDQFTRSLEQANGKFEECLNRLNWSELVLEHNYASSLSSNHRFQSNVDLTKSSNLIVNPPLQTMEFQPIALYLNVVLHSFNDLRLCAPLSLHYKILG
jgi:hypothetical protein